VKAACLKYRSKRRTVVAARLSGYSVDDVERVSLMLYNDKGTMANAYDVAKNSEHEVGPQFAFSDAMLWLESNGCLLAEASGSGGVEELEAMERSEEERAEMGGAMPPETEARDESRPENEPERDLCRLWPESTVEPTNDRITLEQCQRRQEALELDVQQCQEAAVRPTQRSKDQDISNHKYMCWDEQALHVDTNVQRKTSKDQDISNHKYTCWDVQALHVDTNVAIAYNVDTLAADAERGGAVFCSQSLFREWQQMSLVLSIRALLWITISP
jgi:hypothetical protein